jgi:hypothetical protein
MVETEGTELPTPHPVIEPVSDIRVRNGNFRCRDGSVKTAVPPLRDRYRGAQRLERPPHSGGTFAFFAVCSRRIVAVRCREHLPFSVDWRFRDRSSLKNGLSAGPAQPIGVED